MDAERRMRWAVGELLATDGQGTFRYFANGEFERMNCGLNYSELQGLGYRGYPSFIRNGETIFSIGVLDAFMRRITPSTRSDFPEYLAHYRLSPDLELPPLSLLGNIGARLPSDGFALVDPLQDVPLKCEFIVEVAGFRHYRYAEKYEPIHLVDLTADFRIEPDNEHDPNAIAIFISDKKIGYIDRLQAQSFGRLLTQRCVSAVVDRINGTDERPRCYLFVRVRNDSSELAA